MVRIHNVIRDQGIVKKVFGDSATLKVNLYKMNPYIS